MVSARSVIQHIVETFQLIVIDSYEEKRMINRVDILGPDVIFDSGTLYIAPGKDRPDIRPPESHCTYLLLTSDSSENSCGFSPIRISQMPDPRTLFTAINNFLKQESITETHITQLYHALYYGHGLKDIVTKAEEFLHHPISICDASYNIIEKSPMMDHMPYGIERNETRTFLTGSEIESLKRLRIENKIYESRRAFFSRTADHPDTNWIFCAIRIQNVMAGYVAVCLESNIEATDYDLRITTVLADICAIEMQKHDLFVTRSGMKYENFLVDLLEGRFHDVNLISSRLELLDRKFCQFFCLVVFMCTEPHDSNLFNKRQMSTLRTVYPNSMSVVYQDMIVLFLNQDTPILLNEKFTEPLKNFAGLNHMKAGISQPFTDILKIKTFYEQALRTLELGDSARSTDILYFSSELLPEYLFASADYTGLEVGIHHHLKQLMDHDRKNHTEFILTLRSYLDNNRNAAKTAEHLHIHRSTFFYRVKKIEELLDISLTDSHLLFLYELSFKIWDYLSR